MTDENRRARIRTRASRGQDKAQAQRLIHWATMPRHLMLNALFFNNILLRYALFVFLNFY